MSEVVLRDNNSGLSPCLSIECQKIIPKVVFKVVHSGMGVKKSVGLVEALLLSCSGYFYATVSLLSHLTVEICYAIIGIC